MKLPLRLALCSACLALRLPAADEPASAAPAPANDASAPAANAAPAAAPATEPASTSAADEKKLEDAIRQRLAEHALKKSSKSVAIEPPPSATDTPASTATQQPVTVMPRIEVSRSRVTELAIELQAIDREIAKEKKLTKPTAVDDTLNDAKVSHALSIFGGSSSEDRARLAEERVSLLEAERDIVEQLFQSQTKEEREQLEKERLELQTMRRELERETRDDRAVGR